MRVTTSNAADLLTVGLRSDGRVGDYVITNGSLLAVIDAPGIDEELGIEEQLHRAPSGGTLVDLSPPGAVDALSQVIQLVGYDPELRVLYQSVTVEEDGKELHAVGRILDPERKVGVALDELDLVEELVVSTTWRMWDRQPWLEVETIVSNQTGRPVELDTIVDLVVTDGLGGAPFAPAPGVGYQLLDSEPLLTPWVVFDADPSLPGAMAMLSLDSENLWVMADSDLDGRVRGVFVGVEDRAKDAIAPGEQRSWSRRYTASAGADMAGVTHEVLELLGMQTGSRTLELGISEGDEVRLELQPPRRARATFHRVDPARYVDAEGRVRDGGVMPMTTSWSDGGGPELSSWLSHGRYEVEIESAGFCERVAELDVQPGLEDYGVIQLPDESLTAVRVQLLDLAGDPNTEPARITVVGLGGTADPQLARFGLAGDALAAGRRVWTDAGQLELLLPDGAYRVIASRGPRYPLVSAELRVPVQDAVELALPEADIEVDGWVEADPFTASWASIFGGDPAEDVSMALCSEGIALAVSAEAGGGGAASPGCDGQQIVVGALAPMDVPRTGVGSGDGWMVGFPVQGRVRTAGLRPGDWIDQAWAQGAQVTVILTPRARGAAGAASGMFHARGFDRDRIDDGDANRFLREASAQGTTALDAGALELLSPQDPWHTSNVLQDWMALLQAGYRLSPVASSHSAWLLHDRPGAARTLILTGSEQLEDRLVALAEGRTVATSGPMLDVVLHGPDASAGPGETLVVPRGTNLELELRVRAAAWVPVERLRVFQDGREAWSTTLDEQGVIDLTRIISLDAEGPGWVVVDAGHPEHQPQGDFSLIYPDMPVYAVTAPIYLDTSGP